MTPQRRSALLRGAGFAAALILVGAAGLWTGRAVQQARQSDPPPPAAPPVPDFGPGDPFPAEPLIAEDGSPASSDELLGGRPGVILFLDPECPACTQDVAVWQTWLEAGALEGIALAGISDEPSEAVTAYREKLGLTFPIYSDLDRVFRDRHGVRVVPTTVLVDASGTVRSAGYQPLEGIEPAELIQRVSG